MCQDAFDGVYAVRQTELLAEETIGGLQTSMTNLAELVDELQANATLLNDELFGIATNFTDPLIDLVVGEINEFSCLFIGCLSFQ